MKANEAPENIYLFENPVSGTPDDRWLFKRSDENDIEYTRTDAIMKKTLEWLRKGGERGDAYIVTEFGEEVIDFLKLAEDLKNYMER